MGAYVEVTDSNFEQEVLKAETVVLVDFWASWCSPCRMIAPIVEELSKEYEGKLKVAKMDVEESTDTPMTYGITGIPTLILFKKGQPVEKIVGAVPKAAIKKAIDNVL
jgi:thioredoxin 1